MVRQVWREQAHTTSVLENNPSPTPTISRPAINIPILEAPASTAAPKANPAEPIPTALVRPILSESVPESKDAMVAERRTEETMIPRIVADNSPKWPMNVGIVVTGPMTPVSNLEYSVRK